MADASRDESYAHAQRNVPCRCNISASTVCFVAVVGSSAFLERGDLLSQLKKEGLACHGGSRCEQHGDQYTQCSKPQAVSPLRLYTPFAPHAPPLLREEFAASADAVDAAPGVVDGVADL
jgi:hypothetical protein